MKPKITPTFSDQVEGQPTLAQQMSNGGSLQDLYGGYPVAGLQTTYATLPPGQKMELPPKEHVTVPFPNIPPESEFQKEGAPAPAAGRPLKIAMIGTAPSSRMLAPYNDPNWQIWVCSPGNMGIVPKADAWFELHDNLDWEENKHLYGDGKYIQFLKSLSIPVFMQNQRLVPHAKIFPRDDLITEFGRNFWSSSFVWMMAFAMKLGAQEIALYGIDMASPGEYIRQRPGFYYFKEKAEERGIKVSAPYESDIMQPPELYGYSETTPMGRKMMSRQAEIKARIAQGRQIAAQTEAKLANDRAMIQHLEGALEDCDYHYSIWASQG